MSLGESNPRIQLTTARKAGDLLTFTLARHSDIRLTMGVYTHIGLQDQSSAIELLPAPPTVKNNSNAKTNLPKAAGVVADLGQLDAMWDILSDDIKARILNLANTRGSESEALVKGDSNKPMVS